MRPIILLSATATCLSLIGLAACGRGEAQKTAAPAAAPELWRIEAINDGKVVKTLDICADDSVRRAFARPTPEFKGQTCDKAPSPAETAGSYAVRCRMDHQNYVVSATTTGDPARDFTVEMSVARQDKSGPTFEQTRRYAKLGACPAGWRSGDAAAPGDKQVVNTLAPSAGVAAKAK